VKCNIGAHSASTRDTAQQALDAEYEVTIHGAQITQDGWTGAGGYLIEGGVMGGFCDLLTRMQI